MARTNPAIGETEPVRQSAQRRRSFRTLEASRLTASTECAKNPSTMQQGVAGREHVVSRASLRRHGVLPVSAIVLALAACSNPPPPNGTGKVGGRVLVAPGVGLVGAHVVVDQVNLYDGKAALRKHVGDVETNANGEFGPLLTGTINGLVLIDASGGTYSDPINGARIQLDPSVHLKALHWLGVFEDRTTTMYVTPVHALVEALFRYRMSIVGDTTRAVSDAYAHLNAHLGALEWEKVIPADLTVPVASPTDEVRASFVLGGLDLLADDLRAASNSTPQVVNLMTLLNAAEQDLGDGVLDGNDANASSPKSGLQVGDCTPVDATCVVPSTGCQLGACRPMCDLYANTYRTEIADSISKFIGPKVSPTVWNRTTLGSEDARALLDGIARDVDTDLFAEACVETQHRAPPSVLWEVSPPDGALAGGQLTLRVHAVDVEGNKLPTVAFRDYPDSDGDPKNDVATTAINTRNATNGIDGMLQVVVIATGAAGNMTTSTRTFQIDNTSPLVTLDSTGLFVDAHNVWWTGTSGPTLHGTVSDMHQGMVQVEIGGTIVATAVVNGNDWTADLPADALTAADNDITIIATDAAGNVATKGQTIRLDATPPQVSVDPSPVFDETASTFNPIDNGAASFLEHVPHGTPVDLATAGSCPTVSKHAQLLFAPNQDGSHAVLGSSGTLNPLQWNVVVTDDGVGIKAGTLQYRILLNTAGSLQEVLPWTAMPPASGSQHPIPLFQDAIPQLITTNGEYHIQLRASDQFGRQTTVERCWNHVVLAPPLRSTSADLNGNEGEIATGFQRALWSTKLDPGAGETGDFAEKFLNADAAGGAVWRARFKNYLGLDVYVKVQIPIPTGDFNASVNRLFQIMHSLMNFRAPPHPIACGGNGVHCDVHTPEVAYSSDFGVMMQTGLRFQGRLFLMNGNETGAEIGTCPGCIADDVSQTYVFKIPARTASQAPLEYGVLTYLRPTLPPGGGTNILMAPSDANQPDPDPAPYAEFQFSNKILTGKPGPLPPPTDAVCVSEDQTDTGEFVCTRLASRQDYRALVRIVYQFQTDVGTIYSFSATSALPFLGSNSGILQQRDGKLDTTETTLP